MLHHKPINEILFLDIETTSQYPMLSAAPDRYRELFEHRYKKHFQDYMDTTITPDKYTGWEMIYNDKAPLSPEFGKIVCISFGMVTKTNKIKVASCADTDEVVLLKSFFEKIKFFIEAQLGKWAMAAHNGMFFDFPFIARRLVINQLPLPDFLNYVFKKPWEIGHLLDTKIMWRWGVFNDGTSLDLLCHVLGVESSKGDMHGSDVKEAFWEQDDLIKISDYCERDVVALATVYLRMNGLYQDLERIY